MQNVERLPIDLKSYFANLAIAMAAKKTKSTKPSKYFVDNFCAAIARARVNAGLTQEDIAEKLGIGRASYAKYEGRSVMPLHLIVQFCLETNTTFAHLVEEANNPPA